MAKKAPKCPVCGKLQSPEHRPFCSKHCADIDLGRWLTESYSVPASLPVDSPPDDEDE